MTLEDRIIELETKLAYQEDTIQSLNDVLCKQQDQIDKLQRSCTTLAERVKEATPDSAEEFGSEPPPPHY